MPRFWFVLIFFTLILSGCLTSQENRDVLFQTSTINALLDGVYDGEVTFNVLRQNGDFGIGTFNNLDGEMIALDGNFYQIRSDGIAYLVDDSTKTPFAVVTYFESDKSVISEEAMDYEGLKNYIDGLVPSENIFYAIKIDGSFEYIKTRSIPIQEKPYPPLVEVVKNQSIFEFHDVKGTLVGFLTPDYVGGINVPGYHLHFITHDRKAGGHLLEYHAKDVRIEIDYTPDFYMSLPERGNFYTADLKKERGTELKKVEE